MSRKPRVLCVCAGGNVRSASVAYKLKELGVDALTLGVLRNEPETGKMLLDWADVRRTRPEPELPVDDCRATSRFGSTPKVTAPWR